MTRQQKVRNAFLDGIRVAAVGTHQLPLGNLRLQQQVVQILQRLLISPQLFLRRRLLGQRRKAELFEKFQG